MPNLEPLPFTTTTTYNYKRRAKSPSFSSILLDAVYRSIDDDGDSNSPPIIPHDDFPNNPNYPHDDDYYPNNPNYHHDYAKQSWTRSKMRSDGTSTLGLETVDLSLRRAILIESWMDKHQHEPRSQPFDHDILDYKKIHIVRQQSVPSRTPSQPSDYNSSTTTSSFSSKNRANLAPRSAESCFRFDHAMPPSKRVQSLRIFTKTKSRAMKLYGDLKKPKQPPPVAHSPPVSPGGRIAAFINSIFRNSGGAKARRSNTPPSAPSASTCSSASSFSRSCLSKTPSSREKSSSNSTGTKRSVRFYPVSVIVDEDSRPRGHRAWHRENGDDHLKSPLDSKHANSNVNVDENGNNCRKWRREKEIDALMMMIKRNCHDRTISRFDCDNSDEEVNDNAGDGGESCASSDLFELENLSCIGVSRYSEELPVYGTTNLENLRAT